MSCGKCPAKVSAINKSIIKGGCTLAFEHTPGRAYFGPSKERVRGEQRAGGLQRAKGLQEDEVQVRDEDGGSGGGG